MMIPTLICLFLAEVGGQYLIYPELRFQQLIEKSIAPVYPSEDQRAGTVGVVVLEVRFDRRLAVEATSVLESPSGSLASAAQQAVTAWRLAPAPPELSSARGIVTKLTFYFSRCKGRYVAFYSREAPTPVCGDGR